MPRGDPAELPAQSLEQPSVDPHCLGVRLDILRPQGRHPVTDDYGIPFTGVQAKRPTPGGVDPALTKRLYPMLKRFQHAYAKYGGEEIVISAVEAGHTCQPDTWLSRPVASQGGIDLGYVALSTDKGNEVSFMFLEAQSATPAAEQAATVFSNLAAKAGAILRPDTLATLGVARAFEPAALWMTFLMTVLRESQFIKPRRDCTLLVNPFAASVWAIEKLTARKEPAEGAGAASAEPASGTAQTQKSAEATPQYAVRKVANGWQFIFEGEPVLVAGDLLGCKYLAVLLSNPDKVFTSHDLLREAAGGTSKFVSEAEALEANLSESWIKADDMLAMKPQQIRELIAELEAKQESESDPAKKAEIGEQINVSKNYLRTGTNIQGQARTFSNSKESARVSITKAISLVRGKINKKQHLALWQHLKFVKAGQTFVYQRPSSSICWDVHL